MNMIFVFMGAIAVFLNVGTKWKTLLVVLPFAGVLIDIATMWLKGYVSPAFFWLHIPGGGLFGFTFFYVSARAFWEMWWVQKNTQSLKISADNMRKIFALIWGVSELIFEKKYTLSLSFINNLKGW